MYYIGLATLLLASPASAISKPSPSSSEFDCNGSVISPQILSECLTSEHLEGSVGLWRCFCVGQGDSCTMACSGSSPLVREAPSIHSAGMVTEDPYFDGDPKTQSIVAVPLTNHKHTLHNAAAADINGKGGVDITRLSGSKQQRSRYQWQKTSSVAKQQPTGTKGISTTRKIVGGIALGVLVMVV